MITQKMISFKVDVDSLDQLEYVRSTYGINKNKLINYALRFVLDVVSLQEEITRGNVVPNIIKNIG